MSIHFKHRLIIAVCIYVLLSSVSQTKTEPPLYPTKFIYAGTLTPNGYTITKPGYYTLCEDVEFTSGNATAITIDSDYVILNLNYKTIYGSSLDTGITINPSKHDITIQNGTFSDFSKYAIHVNSTSSPGCFNIRLENIHFNNSTSSEDYSFYFEGANGTEIHDSSIYNCTITNITAPLYMCYFYYCKGIQISNITCNNNAISYVLWFEHCANIKILDSTFNNNITYEVGLKAVAFSYCNNCAMYNCQINNNTSAINDLEVTGIYLEECSTMLVEDCSIMNNTANLGDYGAVYGIYFLEVDECTVNNCSITGNQGSSEFYGFYIRDGEKTTINSCQVNNNIGTVHGAHGIYLFSLFSKSIIQNCDVNYNGSSSANGIGIYIDDNADFCIIRNCNCFYNSDGGIFNDNSTTFITGCVAGGNPTNYGGSDAPTPVQIPILGENNKLSIINQFANVEITYIAP